MIEYVEQIAEAKKFIEKNSSVKPGIGIILGTGLGGLANDIEIESTLSYKDIPHFPVSTVETHEGKLLLGTLAGKSVIAMQGRFHFYEGYSMKQITFPVRVMSKMGVDTFVRAIFRHRLSFPVESLFRTGRVRPPRRARPPLRFCQASARAGLGGCRHGPP